jgi:serine phosphatase RsbU (regulator of sigma subunit)
MAKRGGPGISVKMILTTTLLILLTVVGFGVLNVLNIRKVYDQATTEQVDVFIGGRERLGEFSAPVFARALEPQLADNQFPEIDGMVQTLVPQDTRDRDGKRDYGLRLVIVADRNQKLATYVHEEASLEVRSGGTGEHPDITAATTSQLAADAWAKAMATWTANATANNGEVLVRFDLTSGNGKYRVFAFPVFAGEPPTAAAAIAPEAPDSRRGYAVLGYDTAPRDWFAEDAEQRKTQESTNAALRTGAVGALFVLIGTLLAIFQGLSISRPIKQLAWKADQIARGDLDARVEVKTTDEIGVLGENFNFMADQIVILLHQTAEKAKIEQELEVARAIQETLVPPADPVDKGTFRFAGYYQPAAQTGGDWWSWHDLVGGKVLVVIGDVTGHGVPSAMITAAAKAACDVARALHNDDVAVTRLLEIMNLAIFESAKRNFVMTCFASVIDTRKRTITYANAGHNFPYLFRAGDDRKGEFGSLMIRGNRLGDLRESTYESKTTELVPGDILVWYTDGIVECENAAGEEYGEKRFRSSVRRAAALDAGEMRDAIVADAMGFFGETMRKDDISMVIGRIY